MRAFDKLALGAYGLLAGLSAAMGAGLVSMGALEARIQLCVFRLITGVPCPGCGMTHAILHGFQGHWARSYHAHPLGLPLLAVWTLWILHGARNRIRGRGFSEGFPLAVKGGLRGAIVLGGILAVYFIRLAGIC